MEPESDLATHKSELPVSLIELLSYTLILYQTTPYLPVSSLLALGATSKDFRALVYNTRDVFRHLDLTRVTSAQSQIGSIDHGGEVWRNIQLDENVTEDDFYGRPLRGIFSSLRRRYILHGVQTMILDGLAVPADLIAEIITNESFNVRILSIRDVQHLNDRKLQQALLYAIRPSRAEGTPKLQGLYVFGPKDATPTPELKRNVFKYPPGIAPIDTLPAYRGIMSSQGARIGAEWNKKSQEASEEEETRRGDLWFGKNGRIFPKLISTDWASTLHSCYGLLSFDAVLCSGPRHSVASGSRAWYTEPQSHITSQIGTHTLGACSGCGSSPEGLANLKTSTMYRLPLLSPVPLHSSTTKSAKTPPHGNVEKKLLVRCIDCLKGRYCESCHVWWCEDCYQVPGEGHIANETHSSETVSVVTRENNFVKFSVLRSCFECGFNCTECVQKTQKTCRVCGGGYCLVHNEGSTLTTCDWCARSGRRTRELY